MTPYYQIKVDDQDITDRIRDRLISLRITDEAGWQNDGLTTGETELIAIT